MVDRAKNSGAVDMAVVRGKKIARISTVPFYILSQLKGQVEYMKRCGMHVTLISSPGPEVFAFTTGENLRYEIVTISRRLHPVRDLIALVLLFRLFRKNGFDIVHSTTPKAGLLTAIAAFAARVPIRLHTFTGQPWVRLNGIMGLLARMSDRLIGMLSTRCYADSRGQMEFLVQKRVIAAERIGVIGSGSLAGVDLERFDPARWTPAQKRETRKRLSLSAGSTVILFIGRITADKGILELTRAFSRVVEAGYDADLLLVGPFESDVGGRNSIRREDIQQNHRIHTIGYTDLPEQYVAIADFVCLPSYREGFGTVVIEAAAMGVPVIGSDIYGLRDSIENGVTGLLVPPKQVTPLFEAMKRMLDGAGLARKMGQAARKRCRTLFDAQTVNRLVVEEYVRLIRGASTQRSDKGARAQKGRSKRDS